MKKTILVLAALTITTYVFGQGQINFNTRVTSSSLGTVNAPIYGPDVNDPSSSWEGATPPGGYVGTTIAGTGFTAELWGGPAGSAEGALVLVGTTTFRTNTSGIFAGHVQSLAAAPTVPGVPGGSLATFQLRVYDNVGGTITEWAGVGPTTASGKSSLFSPAYPLGGGVVFPPNLEGLTSFNLSIVPEPSAIALGVLGLGALVLFRRRKN